MTPRDSEQVIDREDLRIIRDKILTKCLVGAEADDRQTQGVDGQFVILHVFAEDIGDGCGPSFALDFAVVRRIREHLFEFDPRRIR